jgi:peptidoglycan/LPS O-acetylase OafA/YrhL
MHNNRRHILLMLLCCLVPLAALAAIVIFKVPVSNVLYVGLVLLCPLGMFLMMALMRNSHDADHDVQTKTIEGTAHETHQH